MTELISATPAGFAANAESFIPSISSNGRFVAFESLANDIVPGLPSPQLRQRIFVRDRWTQQTALWSVNVDGTAPMQDSYRCAISADGASVAFASRANNLVLPADPDSLLDIFVRTCPFETPTTYCMAAANSLGCTPQIGATGTPSASSTVPFDVSAILVLNRRAGLLFYSTHGSEMLPLGGGFLCVRPPTMRCAMQVSDGSSAGTDCSGSYHFDFNARIHSGVDPALGVGSDVWAQYWSRDPAAPSTTSLSDALEFHIDL
jgi:hypothetical protein